MRAAIESGEPIDNKLTIRASLQVDVDSHVDYVVSRSPPSNIQNETKLNAYFQQLVHLPTYQLAQEDSIVLASDLGKGLYCSVSLEWFHFRALIKRRK